MTQDHKNQNTRDFNVPWLCPPTYGGLDCSVPLSPAMCDIVGAGHVNTFGREQDTYASTDQVKSFTMHQAWGDYLLVGHQNALPEEVHGRMVAAVNYGKQGNDASSALDAVSIRTSDGERLSIENQDGELKVFDSNCTQVLTGKASSSGNPQ